MADNDPAHSNEAFEFPTRESMGESDARTTPSAGTLRASAKTRLADAQDAMTRKYRVASDATDDFVHENPWKAITLAAVAGLVIGMLASR